MIKILHLFAITFYSTSLVGSFAFVSHSMVVKYNMEKDAAAILQTPNLTQVAEKSR